MRPGSSFMFATCFKVFFLVCFILSVSMQVRGQSSNHWARNFNEESSLLSGAVVGGGSGAAAIYYNPATISEIEESKLSLNASLFSFEFYSSQNAWGDDIDFNETRFVVVPRFISYMIKPPKYPNLSLEVAFMNNENYQIEDINSVESMVDILPDKDGMERYNALYSYRNKFRDDWIGLGGSHKIRNNLFLGASMFFSIRSMNYEYLVDIEAGPNQEFESNSSDDYFTAKFRDQDFLKFNNYRMLWKFGILYEKQRISMGLNITTPSFGIYSDGKKVIRKRSQSNINDPESGEAVPDYMISDFAEKKNMDVNYKSPFSVAAGFTYTNLKETKVFYTSFEYFGGLDPYRMVNADASTEIFTGEASDGMDFSNWLTFVSGAKPVFNGAIGYRWIPKDNLMLLAGFRTDFNYKKGLDYDPLNEAKALKAFHPDRYHITGGVTINVFGQKLMAGAQYSLGYEKDQKQYINLSDPVEYNPEDYTALQGVRKNNITTFLNAVSLYFGATINFGEGRD